MCGGMKVSRGGVACHGWFAAELSAWELVHFWKIGLSQLPGYLNSKTRRTRSKTAFAGPATSVAKGVWSAGTTLLGAKPFPGPTNSKIIRRCASFDEDLYAGILTLWRISWARARVQAEIVRASCSDYSAAHFLIKHYALPPVSEGVSSRSSKASQRTQLSP